MNLRELIEAYANEVSNWDYHDNRGDDKRLAESLARLAVCRQSLDVQLAVAEAALAYVEWRMRGFPASMDGATYIREREKLWGAFKAAYRAAKEFEKAKEDRKSLAGEGET